ncbi:hypothetical protein CKAH01_06012 [Colletotrichum kahawae]|uniref:Uncharacterized protein n=1 Tax=Colletotrichum kahawae TaxID=34407 RepID=A0AAD9YC74_COLKA|nr:hypothetical protein CKAH01_06012 [Colletotrichum kahawae]
MLIASEAPAQVREETKTDPKTQAPAQVQQQTTPAPTYTWDHPDLSELKALPVYKAIIQDLSFRRPAYKDATHFKAAYDKCREDAFDIFYQNQCYKVSTEFLVYYALKVVWITYSKQASLHSLTMTTASNDDDDWEAMEWEQPRNWTETHDMRYQEWLEVFHPAASSGCDQTGCHEPSYSAAPRSNASDPAASACTPSAAPATAATAATAQQQQQQQQHRKNGQYSLNIKGLAKAYTEAWVGLRTFRTELSHGTVDSLGVHFQKYYGSSLLGVLLQGNDWLDRSTAERAQQAAAKEIEKKRQLDAIENLAFDRCGKSKNAAGRRKAYLSDLLEFLHTNLGIKREDFQFNKMEATEAIHIVMFKYEGDDDPVFTKELADSWLWSQLDVKKPKGLNDSMHAS